MTDAVTLSRLPIALAMLVLRRRRFAAAALFVVGVATDLVDGRLARRLGTSSPRGARLDSVADAVFVGASTVVVMATVDERARPLVGRAGAIVAVTRLVTLHATRLRFGSWSIAHTHLNKVTGAALAVLAGVALVRGRMPVPPLAAVAALGEIAAIEELAIVLSSSEYDVDRASLLDG